MGGAAAVRPDRRLRPVLRHPRHPAADGAAGAAARPGSAHRHAPGHRPQHLRLGARHDGPGAAPAVGTGQPRTALLLPQGGGQVPRRGQAAHPPRGPRPARHPPLGEARTDRTGDPVSRAAPEARRSPGRPVPLPHVPIPGAVR
ncbi:hypothetical protein SGPA1_21085 [Streptomyces misionensis JCM 4497]